jgi:hypothetical protein
MPPNQSDGQRRDLVTGVEDLAHAAAQLVRVWCASNVIFLTSAGAQASAKCAQPVEGLAGHILGTLSVQRGRFW